MLKKRIAVLRGGPSNEYEISLESGSNVLTALRNLDYSVRDIVITKKAEWLVDGIVRQPESALETIDLVFIALHGTYGEDGQVQRILERLKIPFTGSSSLTSGIAFNKELTKRTLLEHIIKTPKFWRLTPQDLGEIDKHLIDITNELGPQVIVKPIASGSSLGMSYAGNSAELKQKINDLLTVYEQIMVEEFIAGKEATVGVLNNFRNEEIYALPTVEIVPKSEHGIFSYVDKYETLADEIIPGRFSYPEKSTLSEIATTVHKVLGCQGYSRSDFIIRDGEVYFLEVNTLPGLTSSSLFPKASVAVGLDFPDLIQHLVKTASV